jgi:hypothetical protein
MTERKPRKLLTLGVAFYVWAPVVAVAVLVAIELGWRAFAAGLALAAVMGVKMWLRVREIRARTPPLGWRLQMLLFVLVLSAGGWIVIGGAGIILGVGLGIGAGLPTPRELLPRR